MSPLSYALTELLEVLYKLYNFIGHFIRNSCPSELMAPAFVLITHQEKGNKK